MISRLRLPLSAALLTLFVGGIAGSARAQTTTTLQTPFAIGLTHAQTSPYNFTGRVFEFSNSTAGIASGTLIRRHTVLTAAHVVFDSTTGFATNLSFSRGLYENYFLSTQQGNVVAALSGYQTAVAANGDASVAADARDLGYILITSAPVDENWGNFLADPTQLTNSAGRFILGYPAVTFDGRTMAYIVPLTPYVQIGLGNSGAFTNDQYTAEPGFSGGPVYAVVNGQQVIVAELTSGSSSPTPAANVQTVRAIDKEAAKFLQDAEYTNGLIKKVKISGPLVATRGTPLTYTLTVRFTNPTAAFAPATTDRYGELKLKTDSPGTATQPLVTIKKISNTQFQVTFSPNLRSGSFVNLFTIYDKNARAPKSALSVRLQ